MTHAESEDHGWTIAIPNHPPRADSREYTRSRALMQRLASEAKPFYGSKQWDDHHGGALWLKDEQGWFLVRNLIGVEWSSQFCSEPSRIDALRQNARRLYAGFPGVAEELGIRELLDTPITDAAGVATWTDSICNASVPLPAALHTGVLPAAAGVHHYPEPVWSISLFKRDDFTLWVTDAEGHPAAVVPVAPRGSGNAEVQVVYSTPNTRLHRQHRRSLRQGQPLVLPSRHPLAQAAFAKQ